MENHSHLLKNGSVKPGKLFISRRLSPQPLFSAGALEIDVRCAHTGSMFCSFSRALWTAQGGPQGGWTGRAQPGSPLGPYPPYPPISFPSPGNKPCLNPLSMCFINVGLWDFHRSQVGTCDWDMGTARETGSASGREQGAGQRSAGRTRWSLSGS